MNGLSATNHEQVMVVKTDVPVKQQAVQRAQNFALPRQATSKWGHRSPISLASFLPIFSFLHPSVLDLGSGTGQTDEETTAINAFCHNPVGAKISHGQLGPLHGSSSLLAF